ncbi:MAG: NTP transferase domain-containing protein, partial [Prolixibacteraceae bacterium]|nr:NTP transferase domain-containing protein [Prolixibacteraceae bacterium]
IPKALVTINGIPMIDHAIEKLVNSGIKEIVINIHHFAEQIINHINANNYHVPIYFSDERDYLLDTGGALKKAAPLLTGSKAVIAINVDIISSTSIGDLVNYHQYHNALATLAVRDRQTSRYLLFNNKMELRGWKNIHTNETIKTSSGEENTIPLAFSGIQVLSPDFFNSINETGKFSIIKTYLRLSTEHKIMGYNDSSPFWIDVGKPGEIKKAEKYLSNKR